MGNQSDTVGMLPPNSDSEEEEEMPKSKGNKGQSANVGELPPNSSDEEEDEEEDELAPAPVPI